MLRWAAFTNSAQFGVPAVNGNTASNFPKNQPRLRCQAHCRFAAFFSRTEDLWRTRFMNPITAFLSRAKSWMLRQEKKRISLETLLIPIYSCQFSGPGKL